MAKNFAAQTPAVNTAAAATKRKPRAKKTEVIQVESLEQISAAPAADADYDSLLAMLDAPAPAAVVIEEDSPVVIEAGSDTIDLDAVDLDALLAEPVAVVAAPVETELSEADLEAAVTRAEATDLMIAQATDEGMVEGAAPTGESSDAVAAEPVKVKRERKHYADKVDRLKDRVGASLSEYTVLTTADAMVDESELGAVMERTLEIIRAMNSKEKNRASNFIEFLSGKKAKLNNVLERVLRVLDRDGFIQTGAEGNVIKDLIARPYSIASARAMGGNTIGMYADLKVILADGKGRFVANPDSLLLAKARSLLGAAGSVTESVAESVDAVAADEPDTEVSVAELHAEVAAEIAAEGKLEAELEAALAADPEAAPF